MCCGQACLKVKRHRATAHRLHQAIPNLSTAPCHPTPAQVAVEETFSGEYVVVFDPLDGSSNIDAGACRY